MCLSILHFCCNQVRELLFVNEFSFSKPFGIRASTKNVNNIIVCQVYFFLVRSTNKECKMIICSVLRTIHFCFWVLSSTSSIWSDYKRRTNLFIAIFILKGQRHLLDTTEHLRNIECVMPSEMFDSESITIYACLSNGLSVNVTTFCNALKRNDY